MLISNLMLSFTLGYLFSLDGPMNLFDYYLRLTPSVYRSSIK
jgi:hypothetical protein